MRVCPIADSLVPSGHSRIILTDNANLDDVRPVEALIGPAISNHGAVAEINVLIQLEPEDLESIQEGGKHFWLSVAGISLPPFGLTSIFQMDESQMSLPL